MGDSDSLSMRDRVGGSWFESMEEVDGRCWPGKA